MSTEPSANSSDSLRAGDRVGPWVLEHEIGRGGMGVVYAVRHEQIGKRAAIKVMHRRLDSHEHASQRMLLEAQVVNAIGHPHIIDVFDVGALADGRPYIVMEQLVGRPLSEATLDRATAFAILADICDALIAAHSAGVVHRDLKPENIFLVDGAPVRVKLLDWGIARVLHVDAHHTIEGQLVGTPRYLAPEQARGEPVTLATDVYSLGVVAYELLLGAPPFEATSAAELLGQHLYVAPRAPRSLWRDMPAALEDLLLGMLAKDAAQRPTVARVAERLASIAQMRAEPPPAPSPRPRRHARVRWQLVVGVLALAGTAGLVALALRGDDDSSRPRATPPVAARATTPAMARPQARNAPVIANPVLEDCADPGVLHDGTRWFISCTGGMHGDAFPIYASDDLRRWSRAGSIFTARTRPAWADGDTWSPQLARLADGYRAYYTMRIAGGKNAIGVASAASPTGPYADRGTPLVAPPGGASDPYVAVIDGRRYLYFKREGRPSSLWVVPLTADGRATAGTAHEVLAATEPWEHGNVEAPLVARVGDHIVLLYSGSQYCDPSYAIGAARATSPLGPFEKSPAPLVTSNEQSIAPGHPALTDGPGGGTLLVYHAYRADQGTPSCEDTVPSRNRRRHVRIDPIDLAGAWPRIGP